MRVIAGVYGGRRLVAPKGLSTRPTSDRVREALFSSLGPLGGASVLDLYAGTGALGIEALSRGAERATFVESARPALVALRQNLSELGLHTKARVLGEPVERAVATPGLLSGPWDLVLLDPPYARIAEIPSLIDQLLSHGSLAPGSRVVVEHASRDPSPNLHGLSADRCRTYGDTAITIYQAAFE